MPPKPSPAHGAIFPGPLALSPRPSACPLPGALAYLPSPRSPRPLMPPAALCPPPCSQKPISPARPPKTADSPLTVACVLYAIYQATGCPVPGRLASCALLALHRPGGPLQGNIGSLRGACTRQPAKGALLHVEVDATVSSHVSCELVTCYRSSSQRICYVPTSAFLL